MTAELASNNVVAAFRDLELASEALGDLRDAGFADHELSVLGRHPDELDVVPERSVGEPLAGGAGVFKQIATGTLAGTGIGGLIGAAGGAAVAAIPGVGLVVGIGALLGALGGSFAGGTVGAIVEGESALRTDAGWKQTFDAIKEGAVVLGVHTDDVERVEEAEAILARHQPMDQSRVNDRGEEVSVGERGR